MVLCTWDKSGKRFASQYGLEFIFEEAQGRRGPETWILRDGRWFGNSRLHFSDVQECCVQATGDTCVSGALHESIWKLRGKFEDEWINPHLAAKRWSSYINASSFWGRDKSCCFLYWYFQIRNANPSLDFVPSCFDRGRVKMLSTYYSHYHKLPLFQGLRPHRWFGPSWQLSRKFLQYPTVISIAANLSATTNRRQHHGVLSNSVRRQLSKWDTESVSYT